MTVSHSATELDKLNIALEEGAFKQISHTLNNILRPSEVAHLIEKSPPKERHLLWSLIHQDIEGEVLQDLGDDVQAEILSKMNTSEVLAITETLEIDDLVDLIQQLPETVMHELLRSMDHQNRERLETALSFIESVVDQCFKSRNRF